MDLQVDRFSRGLFQHGFLFPKLEILELMKFRENQETVPHRWERVLTTFLKAFCFWIRHQFQPLLWLAGSGRSQEVENITSHIFLSHWLSELAPGSSAYCAKSVQLACCAPRMEGSDARSERSHEVSCLPPLLWFSNYAEQKKEQALCRCTSYSGVLMLLQPTFSWPWPS